MRTLEKPIFLINPALESPSSPVVKKLHENWLDAEQKMVMSKVPQINWDNVVNIRRCRYKASMGLLSIGSILRFNDFDVRYLDEQLLLDNGTWANRLQEVVLEAGLVGITSMTVNSPRAIAILQHLRKINSTVPIVMGGCHFSYLPEQALRMGADAVVKGQGEFIMLELVKSLAYGLPALSQVKGLFLIDECGHVRFSGERDAEDISVIPPVDFEMLPKEMQGQCEVYIFSTRGCRNRCSFCTEGHYWDKLQTRPMEVILREISSHNNVIHGDVIFLNDSSLGQDSGFTSNLLGTLKRTFPHLYFRCLLRADAVTGKFVRLLEVSNFVDVQMGIESACSGVLELLNKGETFSDYLRSLHLLRSRIPIIRSSWMVGCPGDSHQTLAKSLDCMVTLFQKTLIDEATVRMFVPYPGTPIFRNPSKFGIRISTTEEWGRFDRRNIHPVVNTENLRSRDIARWYVRFAEKSLLFMRSAREKQCRYKSIQP